MKQCGLAIQLCKAKEFICQLGFSASKRLEDDGMMLMS
jgi:hypothetical protein